MRASTKAKYPKNWTEIAIKTKEAANWKCQWCNNGSRPKNPLTVHHIDYNPGNNEPANLLVLCAACHLRFQQRKMTKITGVEVSKQLHLPLLEKSEAK